MNKSSSSEVILIFLEFDGMSLIAVVEGGDETGAFGAASGRGSAAANSKFSIYIA